MSLAQQAFPLPLVKDLRAMNLALRRACQFDGLRLTLQALPSDDAAFCLHTDASLQNAKKKRTQAGFSIAAVQRCPRSE